MIALLLKNYPATDKLGNLVVGRRVDLLFRFCKSQRFTKSRPFPFDPAPEILEKVQDTTPAASSLERFRLTQKMLKPCILNKIVLFLKPLLYIK